MGIGTSYCMFLWPVAEADLLVLSKFVRSISLRMLSLLFRCGGNSKWSIDGRAIQREAKFQLALKPMCCAE